ncbi:MAG: glycosyltransferase, partial [Alphaproteobacteria bacterium]|nr:glycosyltransferase [Alphaproteobacteria bacterium]
NDDPQLISGVRRFFERLGGRLSDQLRNNEILAEQACLKDELSIQRKQNDELNALLERNGGETSRLRTELDRRLDKIRSLEAERSQYQQDITHLQSHLGDRDKLIDQLAKKVAQRDADLERVNNELNRYQIFFQKEVKQITWSFGRLSSFRRRGMTVLRGMVAPQPRLSRIMGFVRLSRLISRLREVRDLRLIRDSDLFDVNHYLGAYSDVAAAGVDPHLHYLRFGTKEGRDPHPLFSTVYYLQHHSDVAAAGVNPLVHYIRFGAAEGRQINDAGSPLPLPLQNALGQTEVKTGKNWDAIVFVSGFPLTPSETYRVLHPMEVLREWKKTVHITNDEIEAHAEELTSALIIVLFRVAWSPKLAEIISAARKNGCVIVYDLDDYVFEPAIADANYIDGIRFLSEAEVPLYRQGVRQYRQALEASDCCTLSTEFLADQVRELGKPAYVLPNGINPGMLGRYDRALEQRRATEPDTRLRIGYAAGTLTHQRDFGIVRDALFELLTSREDVMLTIVGQINLSEFPELEALSDRVELRQLVPHNELPNEIARFDINIAPLEVGNPFCEAKSELKFFDAALLEVPTVASATQPLCAAIRHGESGFIAETREQWAESLTRLLDDRRLRMRMGKLARAEALRRFGPGTMRQKVKQVFDAVLGHRRVTARPRGNSYDRFLYAINYLPVPTQSAKRQLKKIGSPGLQLHWIIPAFSAGWGGMTNIFRIVQQLENFGHQSVLWVHNPPRGLPFGQSTSDYYRQVISEHFLPIKAKVDALPDNLDEIVGDAVIATDHYSAYPARAVANVTRKFYFLQDNEPAFSPAGYAALFAEATYKFGFDALSNGVWLHELARRHGMWSMMWDQAADPEHYFMLDPEDRWPGHIAFYGRQETPRRTVELGFLAFELLAREGISFHLHLFGGTVAPASLPYPFTNHGILTAAELGKLYRSVSMGVVFSATNYSIIPREMMACGLPVVELNSESSRRSFADGAAALVEPTPESAATHIKSLLLDHRRRRQLAQRGRDAVAAFSWEKAASDIEAALLHRLEQAQDSTKAPRHATTL